MSHLQQWQPLTHRYGINKDADSPTWARRHTASIPQTEPVHRCDCPSTCKAPSFDRFRCRQPATQEDLYCDECRHWC